MIWHEFGRGKEEEEVGDTEEDEGRERKTKEDKEDKEEGGKAAEEAKSNIGRVTKECGRSN
jgi:hypothetical protein